MESIHVRACTFKKYTVSLLAIQPQPSYLLSLPGASIGLEKRWKNFYKVPCREVNSLWFILIASGVRSVFSLLSLNIAAICAWNPYEFRSRTIMKHYQSPAARCSRNESSDVAWFAWDTRVGESRVNILHTARWQFAAEADITFQNWMRKVFKLGLSSLNIFFLCKYFFTGSSLRVSR